MSHFYQVYKVIGTKERGYTKTGKREYYHGISRREYPMWEGWGLIDEHKHKLSFPACLERNTTLAEHVADFHKRYHWDVYGLDDVQSYKLCEIIYEQALWYGQYIVYNHIQNICNALNSDNRFGEDLDVDSRPGVLSRNRLIQVASYDDEDVCKALVAGLIALQGHREIHKSCRKKATGEDRLITTFWLSDQLKDIHNE